MNLSHVRVAPDSFVSISSVACTSLLSCVTVFGDRQEHSQQAKLEQKLCHSLYLLPVRDRHVTRAVEASVL